ALIGFAAQTGRNADDVGARNVLVAARGDDLVGHARSAMQHVEGLTTGQVSVDIKERDLAHDAAALERKARPRSAQTAAADDGDFHIITIADVRLQIEQEARRASKG